MGRDRPRMGSPSPRLPPEELPSPLELLAFALVKLAVRSIGAAWHRREERLATKSSPRPARMLALGWAATHFALRGLGRGPNH